MRKCGSFGDKLTLGKKNKQTKKRSMTGCSEGNRVLWLSVDNDDDRRGLEE